MIHPLVRAAFAKKIRWQPSGMSRGRKDRLFVLRVRDLDAAWRRNPQYIAPGDSGMTGKFAKLRQYIDDTAEPVPLDAPEVAWQEWDQGIGFIDGRHRAALVRDLGADRIMVAVPPEQADEFQTNTKAKPVSGPTTL